MIEGFADGDTFPFTWYRESLLPRDSLLDVDSKKKLCRLLDYRLYTIGYSLKAPPLSPYVDVRKYTSILSVNGGPA